MTRDPALRELWHVGTTACFLAMPDAEPPFVVQLCDGAMLIWHREFDDHDLATAFAVEELRKATD